MSSIHYRTARIRLRLTKAQRLRAIALLAGGGDVWAALIEMNHERLRRGARPIANYQELCREVAGVPVGELSTVAIRSVIRRYADGFFEAARRKRAGERARYPRRRRALFPLRWYAGNFALIDQRLRLSVARGAPEFWVRLSRPVPYPAEAIRSVTLLADGGALFADVTAIVPTAVHDLDPSRVAGVDMGIIHPYAVAAGDAAIVISGRALRAEERLHLEDTKRRIARMSRRTPRRGQRGSRRWRQLRAAQRKAESRHRRRIRVAHHEAAKEVVAWAVTHRVGTLAIGDPAGIGRTDRGRHQNLRLRQWRRSHLLQALRDKAGVAGIAILLIDERGTSSRCPECGQHTKPMRGRVFVCPHCGHQGHRDVIGARNIASRAGGSTAVPAVVTHRRAGAPPARRDRRRQLYDRRRFGLTPGRPGRQPGSRSTVRCLGDATAAPGTFQAGHTPAADEDRGGQPCSSGRREGVLEHLLCTEMSVATLEAAGA